MPGEHKLFHYTTKESALEYVLPSGRIGYGRLPRTNDPIEFQPARFAIAGFVAEGDDLTAGNPFALVEEAAKHLRESVHILCLTEDRPTDHQQYGFGNGALRARMWAQYGENHSGVCLCFDAARLRAAAEAALEDRAEGCDLVADRVRYLAENERLRCADAPAARS